MVASGEIALSADITELLNSRTEWWIEGLKLAMISIKDRIDKDKSICDFRGNNRYILDYLVEQVLMNLPQKIRNFMARISIPPRFNDDLCRKLTGSRDTFESLKYIEQHNLFLIPLDDHREWFRYHHLFRDCLKKILEQEKKEEIHYIYKEALQWFEQNGYSEEAFHIAVESKDIKTAANILSGIIPEIFSSGGEQFILPFLKHLDKNAILSNPALACYHTWIFVINGNFDAISDLETLLNTTTLSRENEELIRGFYDLFQGYALFTCREIWF